jgi:hypothetical protein
MILADVRQSLTRADAQLALRLVGRGSAGELARAEDALRDEGIDALLDDPRLLGALVESRQGAHASLALFTYVATRHALRAAGETNRVMADYVAAIVLHVGLRDRAARVGASDDETYATLAEIAEDLDDSDARRAFLVRAHLGNYALWLSGLFPDMIERRRWRSGGPGLDYYEELGRRGFRLAADHRLAAQHGLAPLYATAAERFAVLRVALNTLSDRFFFPNHNSPDRLMRQVRDQFAQ